MNSCIINGSPKPAKYSVTCQTVHCLPKRYPSTTMRSLMGHGYAHWKMPPPPTMEAMAWCDILLFAYAVKTQYNPPRNFYGVGGMMFFRELIWVMWVLIEADYDYDKSHGVYDFSQKQREKMLVMCGMGALVRNRKTHSKMDN